MILVVGVIAVFVFDVLRSTSGVICKENPCVNTVGPDSLRLEGGRSTLNGIKYDGYVALTESGALVGYVCSTDEETKHVQGNAICRTLGFEKAYDIPNDNRYGTPLETLQSYKLNCTYEDPPCVLEITDDCNPKNVLSVWCIKDYSVRLVTDDTEKFMDNGFFAYYLNFTWWKVPSSDDYQRLCKEFGFAERSDFEPGKQKNDSITAAANYNFGDKGYKSDSNNWKWKLLRTRICKPKPCYPYWVNCTGGTAQTILNRIKPLPTLASGTAQTILNRIKPLPTLASGLPSKAAYPTPAANSTVTYGKPTAAFVPTPAGQIQDPVVISTVSTLLVVLVLILLAVLFLSRRRIFRYIEVQRIHDTATRIEDNEIALNGYQDAEKV